MPTVHYTFPKFYVMIEFFGGLWLQNLSFHISRVIALLSFITLLESVFYGYFMLVFVLISITFVRITTVAPALFLLNR